MKPQEEKATIAGEVRGNTCVVRLQGTWNQHAESLPRPEIRAVVAQVSNVEKVRFDVTGLTAFDSVLITVVLQIADEARAGGVAVEIDSLPEDVARLVKLARTVRNRSRTRLPRREQTTLEEIGNKTLGLVQEARSLAEFVGEATLAVRRLVSGKARMRAREFWGVLEAAGIQALPIVTLISFLVGAIISFLGAVTLRRFGAEFAVSYLVGYGMLREMGAVMTGIIMAGRTGAAFAAEIGSMKVNEEIDALRTFGISPMDYVVLPRLIALCLMLPVLTVFANIVGILSGWMVAEFLMGVPGPVFFAEMTRVVGIADFGLGIFKALVFGLLVGVSGCLRGLQCGDGADSVGRATTNAVVTGITLIIFANAVIDWIAATLNI